MLINDLYTNNTPAVAENALNEFAPSDGGGDSGNYFQALASAWYNGTFDSGSLKKGIKSQEDVERLLQRGIVCPDGVTRKFDIGYNSDFDGVVISSDDYYEHADHDETDSRTGKPFGPYDYMEFGGDDLDESAQWRDPRYKGQLYTQEKPDYRDTREYDRAMWNPKPKGYPGRKEPMAGGEFPRTDPLVKGFGRYGVGEPVSKGPRKGLPSRDQITSLKGSIKDAHGKHHKPNLPEQGVAEGSGPVTHRIGLTVTDPNHPMVSKRGETYQKTVRVTGNDREDAINQAIAHHRRKGYKVHDHHYIGTVDEGIDIDPALAAVAKKYPSAHISKDGKVIQKPVDRPYAPPQQDAEKQQRDLTAKYPNIDDLVADAERNRDPYYDRAEGNAYYAGREAEQNYQKLKQIQRVIQGLNESLQKKNLLEFDPVTPFGDEIRSRNSAMINPATQKPYLPSELAGYQSRRAARKAAVATPDPVAEPTGVAMPMNPYQVPTARTTPNPTKPVTTPNTAMTTTDVPGFNAGNIGRSYTAPAAASKLQTIDAPAQLTGPAPVKQLGMTDPNVTDVVARAPTAKKAPVADLAALPAPAAPVTPNYSKGVAGYSNTTTNAPAASVPDTKGMRPANMMPRTATAPTTSTAPTLTPTEKKEIYQYLTKTMKFGSKEAKDAIKNLPPGISIKDAVKQIFRNSLGKPVTSESLTWSQNFDPGRNLYRRIKQDL